MSKDTYFIFGIGKIEFADAKIVSSAEVLLSKEQSLRLFNSDALAAKEVTVYEIAPKDDTTEAKVIDDKYYSDCNKEIYNLLRNNKNAYGFASRKKNKAIKAIITLGAAKITLRGENGWTDLKTLFDTLNEANAEYVVLRKFEMLPEGFIDGDHDLDILCADLNEIVLLTGATKRNVGISAYQIRVGDNMIDFDIRFIGDNYIDPQWARMILGNRRINEKNISVMNDENQLFSILYHCLTQKQSVSKYYSERIKEIGGRLFGAEPKVSSEALVNLLASFMNSNAYTFRKPLDVSVVQNKDNIKKLKQMLDIAPFKKSRTRNLYIKTPGRVRRFLPFNIK